MIDKYKPWKECNLLRESSLPKSKEGMKSRIYKVANTKGFFTDESWENVMAVFSNIRKEGFDLEASATDDSTHSNGYTSDMSSKSWDLKITNPETGMIVKGQLIASDAGTVDGPKLSRYDLCLLLF